MGISTGNLNSSPVLYRLSFSSKSAVEKVIDTPSDINFVVNLVVF